MCSGLHGQLPDKILDKKIDSVQWGQGWCAITLEKEGAIPKLFPQSREHEIVKNL